MLPLIMAAAGMLKGRQDREQHNKDMGLKAATAMYSPWTKMNPNEVQVTKASGGLAEGLGGFIGGQGQMANMDAADQDMAFKNALMSKLGPQGQEATPSPQKMSGAPMGGFGSYASKNFTRKPGMLG